MWDVYSNLNLFGKKIDQIIFYFEPTQITNFVHQGSHIALKDGISGFSDFLSVTIQL